jgi:hypothetical protein
MAWNESPQSKILQFAQPLFPGSKVEVSGNRNTARGGKKPPYTACLLVDGKVRATGQDRNWRTACKTLQIAISKLSFD